MTAKLIFVYSKAFIQLHIVASTMEVVFDFVIGNTYRIKRERGSTALYTVSTVYTACTVYTAFTFALFTLLTLLPPLTLFRWLKCAWMVDSDKTKYPGWFLLIWTRGHECTSCWSPHAKLLASQHSKWVKDPCNGPLIVFPTAPVWLASISGVLDPFGDLRRAGRPTALHLVCSTMRVVRFPIPLGNPVNTRRT